MAAPVACPGVAAEVPSQRRTWPDPAAFDAQARKLAAMFIENFKTFAEQVTPEVRAAGPRVAAAIVVNYDAPGPGNGRV